MSETEAAMQRKHVPAPRRVGDKNVVQAFAGAALSLTAKVGTLALAGDVVVGFMLFGLVADSTPLQSDQAWHFRGYIFNITLWGITFGLLCIAYSFIYRG